MLIIFFSFLCCPIVCLYGQCSMLWSSLRFPHKYDVRFVFTSSCLYVICVCLCIVVSNTYCVGFFALFFFSLSFYVYLYTIASLVWNSTNQNRASNRTLVNCIVDKNSSWFATFKVKGLLEYVESDKTKRDTFIAACNKLNWFDLLVLCLTPLSAIFQLYHGDRF